MSNKTIADKYQKKTQLEHILDIPDTYIGSVEKIDEDVFVFDDTTGKITKKSIQYIPGLERIFEEILLNSFDQTVRPGTGTTQIKVNINKETGCITVSNNGQGIPVVLKHIDGEEDVWIPEMIFGTLLTSGNYDKTEKKIVGGRNGYGSKLANIFSSEFTLETVDDERKKKFKMTWKNNMSKKGAAKITDNSTKGLTKVSFIPDFKRFNLDGLTDDIISLMKKRVYDIAFNSHKGITVHYNGVKIPIKKMADYIKLYTTDDKDIIVDEDTNDRWSVGLFMSNDNFEHVSFVNGVNTNLGGTHVDYVSKKIIASFVNKIKKKKGNAKNSYIKDKMFVFVKSFIENPSFNSQTKECMTTRSTSYGSTYELTKKFEKQMDKIGIIEEVMSFAKFKEDKELAKTDGKKKNRLTGIPKLDDANWAGTAKSVQCKLILTEGDSAKTFAVSGLCKIGRDRYGIFPLKGKLMNVRGQSSAKIMNNAEISNMKKILGLKQGHKYTSLSETRYGGIVILTDQDVDGSHIKGLVMNMIHTFWPELLELGFVKSLMTPIVKAFKGKNELSFYTETDFENWRETENTKGWKTKYYKGLGTSSAKEAKSCFENFEDKLVKYTHDEEMNAAINLAFNKEQANDRKTWLMNYNRQNIIDQKDREVTVNDFVNKDLIHFSYDDMHRSIPSAVDGFKPTQRKIIYGCLKRNKSDKAEIKVAQLAGYISKETCYHHGEKSVIDTIINLAQSFVGSNNCNLLKPTGQFGTRLQNGKDHASERYINTNVCDITSKIYNSNDNNLLTYVDDDGQVIEPEFYVPCIPMVLVNGAIGIGTGYSTTVLCHNVEDIVGAIKDKLNNVEPKKLVPYYRSHTGDIVNVEPSKYQSHGKYTIDESQKMITVTELPIGSWTENYKEFLEKLIFEKNSSAKEQKIQCLEYYNNHSTESLVKFELAFLPEKFAALVEGGKELIEKTLKLTSSLLETNMHLFDRNGSIRKFKSVKEILDYHFDIRLEFYGLRKKKMIETLTNDVEELKNKVRFIKLVNEKVIKILSVTEEQIAKQLEDLEFTKLKNTKGEFTYDYLISMTIRSLTMERARKMTAEYEEKNRVLEILKAKNIKNMWREDLDEIVKEDRKYNKVISDEINDEAGKTAKKIVKKRVIRKKVVRKVSKKKVKVDYSKMKLPELKAECKKRGMKGYSTKKKAELVALLTEN